MGLCSSATGRRATRTPMFCRASIALALVVVVGGFGCGRSGRGTLGESAYQIDLDTSYRRLAIDSRWSDHEHVWVSRGEDAPLVRIHVGAASARVGEAPACRESSGVGWGDGLLFFSDSQDKPRWGKSADLTRCNPKKPELSYTCSVYFADGRMDRERALVAIAPCRSLSFL